MENPADDPREFSAHHPEDDVGPGGSPDEILRAQFIEQSLRRGYPLNDTYSLPPNPVVSGLCRTAAATAKLEWRV